MYINKTIAEICDFFNDGNWIESKDQAINGIRLIQTGNIGKGFFKNKEENKRYISTDTFTRLKCCEIFEGDILVSRLPDPIGRSCKIPTSNERMITAVDCSIIRLNESVNPDFFLFFSQSNQYFNQIKDNITGTTRSRISRSNLGKIFIPVPSLSVQQAIVEKLDFAFEAIEKAKANIEKNILNAKELFQSKLNEIFSQKGEGWEEKTLEQISDISSGFAFKSVDFQKSGSYQVIRMGNIRPGIIRYDENPVFLSEIEQKILNKSLLKDGDIIITQTGSKGKRDYGFSVLVEKNNLVLNQRISYIRTVSKIKKFILYYTWSEYFRDQFFEKENGTVGQGNVSINAIKSAVIFVPNLQEQERTVIKLDQLHEQTNLLQEKYKQKLANLEELKKSILEKAFRAELV